MRNFGVVSLAAVLMFMTVAPAAAQDGGYVNPLASLLLFPFAVAGAVTLGAATVLTAPFAYPYAPYAAAYPHAYPYADPYAYSYPGAYAAPVYAYAAPATAYWYYCASAGRYYPYVSSCPEQWIRVAPRLP